MLNKCVLLIIVGLLAIGFIACPKKPLPIVPKVEKPKPPEEKQAQVTQPTENIEKVKESTTTIAETGEPSIREKEFDTTPQLKTVYFDFDKIDILPDEQKVLQTNATELLKSTGTEILVEGHTCECGTNEYNLSLGQKRAQTIRDYYIKLGIESTRIATISYGKEKPINLHAGPPDSPKCAINRRAETKIRTK